MKPRIVLNMIKVPHCRKNRVWFSYKNFKPVWAFLLLNVTFFGRKFYVGIVWEKGKK